MGDLFGSLPEYAPQQPEGWANFYLMVDPWGAAELTRPVVEHNTFTASIERVLSRMAETSISAPRTRPCMTMTWLMTLIRKSSEK